MILQLVIKRLIGTGVSKPFLPVIYFLFVFFIVELCIERYAWYYNLQLHPCVAFPAMIKQLASPEKRVILHWQCTNRVIFFKNILQPIVEKLHVGIDKVICLLLKWITIAFKHNKNLFIM